MAPMSHLHHQVTLLIPNTLTQIFHLTYFPASLQLYDWFIMSLQPWSILSRVFVLLWRTLSQPLCWWQPAWSHGYERNNAELHLLRAWPEPIKPPPQTWFSFPLQARRCLRNVMISVTFTLLEVEDYPHHLIFPQYYYNIMLCFFKILWANALSMWQIKASRRLILGMEWSQGTVSKNNIVSRVGSKQWDQLVCQSHELAFSGVNTSLTASLLTPCRLCRWENTFLCAYRFLLPCHASISVGAWGCRRGMQLSSDSLIPPAARALSGLGDKCSVLYDVRSQKCFCIWLSWGPDVKGVEFKCLWGLLLLKNSDLQFWVFDLEPPFFTSVLSQEWMMFIFNSLMEK